MNKPKSSQLEALLASLYRRINYERQLRVTPKHFKLQNMREFLRRLGDPHLAYPVVHVAGTKGKGSVATMVGQILKCNGRRTGVYTSPHLETIHQRLVFDGMMITDQQLVDVLSEIEPIADALDAESESNQRRPLTFFEVTTAAAFCFFASQKADAVVLEVGLGGRLDSTNVCQPLVSVITNISYDHTKQLGSTLDKIAFEKAGIIKPGVQVISGAVVEEAAKVIADVAAGNAAPLAVLGRDFDIIQTTSVSKPKPVLDKSSQPDSGLGLSSPFAVRGQLPGVAPRDSATEFSVSDIQLSMIGSHQQTNAAISVAAIESLNQHGWNITEDQIRAGLAQAQVAGRTEIISQQPLVIVDIAHNVASAQALAKTLQEFGPWKLRPRKTLIVSTSRDKDTVGILEALLPCFDNVIFTKYLNNPRGTDPQKLLSLAAEIRQRMKLGDERKLKFAVMENPEEAWLAAIADLENPRIERNDQAICVAGSAFLVAELRPLILDSIGL